MKKVIYIICFFSFFWGNSQFFLDNDNIPDKIINDENNIAFIDINRKKIKIFLNKIPLNHLYDRAGAGVDNIDIYSNKRQEIQITGNCCVGVSETAYYKYIPKYDNWLLYKTAYIENSANITSNIDIKYFPYSLGIDDKKYNPNKKKYLEDVALSAKVSNRLFNEEFKDFKKNDLKYTIEDFGELLKNIPINASNIDKYNNLAYYLSEKDDNISIYLLEQIINKFPERIVAYLNLADSYWNLGEKEKAVKNYQKYVELMKSQNKDLKKIPQRVWERTK
ncbi:hypothetical protein SAMN05421786_106139 [Chryseobacterium ureilyticum]|uniref:Uncharacterized protein n=1 Tax=Chryseobacterium ureilyticum TaxID=373668 RepID=A0A1N7PS43_9FLAO|nr:tetratricopeptide repeat protein [Chryseobacterium ureilyticum]SIT13434.1 hypothetical protein SAMN05421786_106139 [Chryseobacterium ureilyticum]